MKSLVLFGEPGHEAPWHKLARALGLRDEAAPVWHAPRGATPPDGAAVRRMLEQSACRHLGAPLTHEQQLLLSQNFPGLYARDGEDDDVLCL